MKILITLTMSLSAVVAEAGSWNGHLATLYDAQIACRDTDSQVCLPYLAEAVAVANVLTETAAVERHDKITFSVVFHGGVQEHCSTNWLQSMNGLRLLHSALGIDTTVDAKNQYWTDALLHASRELCHS